MNNQTKLALALVGAGLGAAAGFTGVARSVRRREVDDIDELVRQRLPRKRHEHTRTARIVEALGKSGKWYVHGPIAAAVAAELWRRGHPRAGAAIALASASSAVASKVFDSVIFRVTPPPGHPDQSNKSFPSGHTLEIAALALTAGYVTMREELAPAAAVVPLAVGLPALSAAGRMYMDRHWASDVAAGWMGGVALACWCAAAYEMMPEEALQEMPRRVQRAGRRLASTAADTIDAAGERVERASKRSSAAARRIARQAARAGEEARERVSRTARGVRRELLDALR